MKDLFAVSGEMFRLLIEPQFSRPFLLPHYKMITGIRPGMMLAEVASSNNILRFSKYYFGIGIKRRTRWHIKKKKHAGVEWW